jgi:NADPH-dependent 2,4-dienoyl-CoA reductase/sulfur reductase-like enzyme
MICDPDMPAKAMAGRTDDIRACIGCNQACIGHFQLGLSISCIQHPETGRELQYGEVRRAERPRRIAVIGGGPAGLKAAAVAAERGHAVDLYERDVHFGGQTHLAQLLPHRAEFGGIIGNLVSEANRAGARLHNRRDMSLDDIRNTGAEAIILACGSRPHLPDVEIGESIEIVHASEILDGSRTTGNRVVVYDWLADWTGVGIAERLAQEGAHVRLAVNGICAAANIQNYIRDEANARLFRLGIEVLPWMRLYGAEDRTAYFLHTAAQEAVVLENVDTLVLACPNRPSDELADGVRALGLELHLIGDCLAPRTAEEAVYEGLKAGLAV